MHPPTKILARVSSSTPPPPRGRGAMSSTLFELQMVQGSFFKNVLEAISDLSSEAYFDFSATGLKLQAVDTRSVALVELLLRSEAFVNYSCNSGLSVGLNVTDMANVFRCANKDDIITIKSEHFDYAVTCNFKSQSPDDGEISCFEFEFMDTNDGLPMEIPESEYKARISMPSAKFVGICNKLSCFDDREDVVLISVDEEGVMFYTRGETGRSSIFCRQTQIGDKKPKPKTTIEMKERVSLFLDLRRMNSFSKASALSDQVTISLSPQLVVFEYNIEEMGYIRYYLPPRTAMEDEMQNEGDDTAKEDKMQNVGEEMQN